MNPIPTLRPSATTVERYRKEDLWRADSILDDLARWRAETPDAPAVIASEAGRGIVRLSYAQYAEYVDRFAGALHALGVRSGQVVAMQLPNVWQAGPLVLACARLGAVAAPIMCAFRPRELERMLRRLDAVVCVTIDRWDNFEHAAALAEMAPRLPALRHRVVLGEKTADEELDFREYFEHTEHGTLPDASVVGPDRVSLVLFTSGTSGEPKAVLHTMNTCYAWYAPVATADGIGPDSRVYSPNAATHIVGLTMGLFMPLHRGACVVITDLWDPEAVIPFLAEAHVSWMVIVPVFLSALIDAMERTSLRLPTVRIIRAGGTTVPQPLFRRVTETFGIPLDVGWGMTEGANVFTRSGEHPDLAGRTVGRPAPGHEIDLRADHPISDDQPGRLFVRSPSLCLATWGRDDGRLTVLAEHDDGWYDTGDLAAPDGHGGIRLHGRAEDRIGVIMIPVSDVESALLDHPDVRDVALVGYPDGHGGELACAVVVAGERTPTLEGLRDWLGGLGMSAWCMPSRLELLPELPRNETGKVRKNLLRERLQLHSADHR
ncbi:AMP-binding protein [Streptomyces djakartensis]|uniref:Cyclohexanecarboxylate-CoA ligase n=1 Tax=Streptomyces djakartensis TaxID=68193 RepID=A0ABQ2ZD76_9ACTN|nr:AMP-binding protein [Streptomyces djakartensis]GGY13113.1 cyclohexanecarboxylate-CoA ligase [Streptomyces djakartensis]